MWYYKLWEENFILLRPEWMICFEDTIQVAYAKVDKYIPWDWRMYNEQEDSGYNNGYNQGLTEGHDDRYNEANEYYQQIFERELREAKESWPRTYKEIGSLPCEDIDEEFKEEELPWDEWKDYKKDSDW